MPFDERASEVRDEDPMDSENLEPIGDKVEDIPEEEKEYRFPDEHELDFQGLMYLGKLQDEFDLLGHKIVIRTLTADEILGIGLILKRFENTVAYERAYATAIVAATVVSVDDQELPIPLGRDKKDPYSHIWQRFNYIKSRWYNPTIDAIYAKYQILDGRSRQVFASMGKA